MAGRPTTARSSDICWSPSARRILLRLISFGEARSDTRRQQPRSKLRAGGDAAADFGRVLHPLIAARLLTADDDAHGREACVDLAHEVLIPLWIGVEPA
jgi:conflict system STAND superfamily ATPase